MKKKIFTFGILLFILVIPNALAFGVTTFYFEKNPLLLSPGESEKVDLVLQNMLGKKDVTLEAKIVDGSDIGSIIDESAIYNVPAGRKDIKVGILVNIPEDYPLGGRNDIVVEFKQVSSEGEGMVEFAGAVTTRVPVLIENEGEETKNNSPLNTTTILTFIIVALLVVTAIMITRRRKSKK